MLCISHILPRDDTMSESEFHHELFQMIRGQGANVVGVGPAERFAGAPKGHRPEDIVPGARSVVTFGIRIPHYVSHWPECLSLV